SANASAKPTYQPRGEGCRSTIALILSVTDANVCPGASTACPSSSPGRSRGSDAMVRLRLDLGVRVPQPRQVRRARAGVQLSQNPVVPRIGLELGDLALGVIDVAEDDRAGRAGRLAGGDNFAVEDRPILRLRGITRGVDPLDAVRALLHHPAR